jgi:hypothetical protein
MRAFEIQLNGKRLCVAGLEEGMLLFGLACTENKHGRRGVALNATGLMLLIQESVRWQRRTLRMNDEVRVKIVETSKADRFAVMQKAPHDPRKYENKYVRRMAKEFGWTIQSGARKKKPESGALGRKSS